MGKLAFLHNPKTQFPIRQTEYDVHIPLPIIVLDKLLTQLVIDACPSFLSTFAAVDDELAPSKALASPSSISFLGSPPPLRAMPYVWSISKASLSESTEVRASKWSLLLSRTAVSEKLV
jgi:hypothetical protein